MKKNCCSSITYSVSWCLIPWALLYSRKALKLKYWIQAVEHWILSNLLLFAVT